MKRFFNLVVRQRGPGFGAAAFLLICIAAGFDFSACKSAPVPPPGEEPSLSLSFLDIEAEDPDHLTLMFSMDIRNPVSSAGRAKIASWYVEINGERAVSGLSLESPGFELFPFTSGGAGTGEKAASASFPLTLNMDMAALAAEGLTPTDDCNVELGVELDFSFDSGKPALARASCLAAFPRVRPPEFSITAIAILKAELVNTRFRVGLRINNPNPFPVELSAFGYELYGNNRLWADGAEKNIILVPGKSVVEGNLYLIMNFTNMKRDILDQIINLEDVNYRFTGEARVSTGVDYLPKFLTGFDLSGYSRVYEN